MKRSNQICLTGAVPITLRQRQGWDCDSGTLCQMAPSRVCELTFPKIAACFAALQSASKLDDQVIASWAELDDVQLQRILWSSSNDLHSQNCWTLPCNKMLYLLTKSLFHPQWFSDHSYSDDMWWLVLIFCLQKSPVTFFARSDLWTLWTP